MIREVNVVVEVDEVDDVDDITDDDDIGEIHGFDVRSKLIS